MLDHFVLLVTVPISGLEGEVYGSRNGLLMMPSTMRCVISVLSCPPVHVTTVVHATCCTLHCLDTGSAMTNATHLSSKHDNLNSGTHGMHEPVPTSQQLKDLHNRHNPSCNHNLQHCEQLEG